MMELSPGIRFEVFECFCHSPAYLPRRACNTATPSRLRNSTPAVYGK